MRGAIPYRVLFLAASTAFLAFVMRGLSLFEFSTYQLLMAGASIASSLGEGVALVSQGRVARNRFIWYTFLFLSVLLLPLSLLIVLCAGLCTVGPNLEILSLLTIYVALSMGVWGLIGPIRALKPQNEILASAFFETAKATSAFILVVEMGYGISGALLSLILAQVVQASVLTYRALPMKAFLDLDLMKTGVASWPVFLLPLSSYLMMADVFVVVYSTQNFALVGYYRALFLLALIVGTVPYGGWKERLTLSIPAVVYVAICMKHIMAIFGPIYVKLSPLGPLVATVGLLYTLNMIADERLVSDGTSFKIVALQNPLYLFTLYLIFKEGGWGAQASVLAWLGTLLSFLFAALVVKWFILSEKRKWPIRTWELKDVMVAATIEGLVLLLVSFRFITPLEGLSQQAFNLVILGILGGIAYLITLWGLRYLRRH